MIRKNARELKSSLNAFFKTRRKGTLLGNIYFNRYYRKNPWIKNPLRSEEKKKFNHYKHLFKKYASIYGFDWMLITALAYKESKLDHSKKSPAGAVGIMQLLPGTGKNKYIEIPDIRPLENNIHACVKYLAFLRDRHFDDPNIRTRDQVRFAIAAYNAGPTKIKKIRSMASNMELDPNRWFRNVEIAALRAIGQETVQHVSAVNKYYVIYRIAQGREEIREKGKKEFRNPGKKR
jgi:membrane-bound lytic murein transglycosylase MltF